MCVCGGGGWGGLQIYEVWYCLKIPEQNLNLSGLWVWGSEAGPTPWGDRGRGRARMEMMTFVFKMIKIHQKERVQRLMNNRLYYLDEGLSERLALHAVTWWPAGGRLKGGTWMAAHARSCPHGSRFVATLRSRHHNELSALRFLAILLCIK